MKFSLEAQKLKEQIFTLYYQQEQSSRQWIGIFERLPIGVLLVSNEANHVVHSNTKMHDLLGQKIQKKQGLDTLKTDVTTMVPHNNAATKTHGGGGGATGTANEKKTATAGGGGRTILRVVRHQASLAPRAVSSTLLLPTLYAHSDTEDTKIRLMPSNLDLPLIYLTRMGQLRTRQTLDLSITLAA